MRKAKIIHKSKSRIWMGSIIAALVAAIAVFAVMMQMERNLLMQYEKGKILVAVREIPEGQMITSENCRNYLEERELDPNCIPDTALIHLDQICDMAPVADIEKGVLLTSGMFEKMDEITADMNTPVIAGFKSEDLYQVVGGILRAGDRIHIYSVDEENNVTLNWSDLYIKEVFDNSGAVIANDDKVTSAQRVNVYLDKSDVEEFYSELAKGSLRVVKVCD